MRARNESEQRERQQAEDLRRKVDATLDVATAATRGDLTREMTVRGSDAIGQMGEGLAAFLPTCGAA